MFVPDTPSFYDHTWPHVGVFSETFNIKWKSPTTAHLTPSSNALPLEPLELQ